MYCKNHEHGRYVTFGWIDLAGIHESRDESMYSIMIVEDEMLVRLGMKNSIDWQKYDMSVTSCVSNGKLALDAYNEQKPDIILTDIKMPVMDGLQFIDQIRKTDKNTKVIILTCLEEFEIARQAISLGVSGYILKLGMTEAELDHMLQSLKDELDEGKRSQNSASLAKVANENFLMENLLRSLALGLLGQSRIGDLEIEYAKKLPTTNLVFSLMSIDELNLRNSAVASEANRRIVAVLDTVKDILKNYGYCVAFHVQDNKLALLFGFGDLIDETTYSDYIEQVTEHSRRAIMTYHNLSVTIGISDLFHGYGKIANGYQDCISILMHEDFSQTGKSYHWHQFLEQQSMKHKIVSFLPATMGANIPFKELIGREVKRAIHYIHENYSKDITLLHISKHVGLTPNYLSSLFKKELGVGISDYINRVRIEKAKDLIIHSDKKIFEVRDQVGFSDNSYFCRVFKRQTGMNPNQFKRLSSSGLPHDE